MNTYPFKHLQVFFKDELEADIYYKDGKIEMTKYDNTIGRQFFIAEDWTPEEIIYVLSHRAIPSTRANIKEILQEYGMEKYDAIELLKRMHGLSTDDFIWFKFDDENLKYEDIKIRD